MPRRLRYVPERALVEVTCRTVQGRLLLRPSARLNDLALGILGRAQARYGLRLHAFVLLSNHLHILASPASVRQLSLFMTYVEANLAKEAGRLHDWRGPLWSRRYQAIVVSDEEEAQIARLAYILRHGVKEHLVASPGEWPGVNVIAALLEGEELTGTWVDRTLEHRLRRKGQPFDPRTCQSRETVSLSPLPCWEHCSAETYRVRIAEIVAMAEEEGRQLEKERGEPLGPAAVREQHPHQRPMKSKRSSAPRVHAACKAVRDLLVGAYRAFVAAFRAAADRLRGGDRLVLFPEGAFPPPLPMLVPGST